MGSLGSGRDWFWDKKKRTKDYFSLNINQLNRKRYLALDKQTVTLRFSNIQQLYTFPIVWTCCNYGGQRPWFQCLNCSKRVGKLHSPNGHSLYRCRSCWNLTYKSCQESGDEFAEACSKIVNLKRRCKAPLLQMAPLAPIPDKPKGIHWQTYMKLVKEIVEATEMMCVASNKKNQALMKNIDRLVRRVEK